MRLCILKKDLNPLFISPYSGFASLLEVIFTCFTFSRVPELWCSMSNVHIKHHKICLSIHAWLKNKVFLLPINQQKKFRYVYRICMYVVYAWNTFLFLEKSFYSLFKHHFPIRGPPFSRFIFDTLALINTINLFQWNWELILDNNQTGYFRQFIGFWCQENLENWKVLLYTQQ